LRNALISAGSVIRRFSAGTVTIAMAGSPGKRTGRARF
jgi:hypothetical protein